MDKSIMEKLPFSEIGQVGVVVKDIDKTVEYLSTLGIGPFEPWRGSPIIERRFQNRPVDYKLKVKMAWPGAV